MQFVKACPNCKGSGKVSSLPPAPTHAGEHSPEPTIYIADLNESVSLDRAIEIMTDDWFDAGNDSAQSGLDSIAAIKFLRAQLADLRKKLGESEAKAQWVTRWAGILVKYGSINGTTKAQNELRAILQKGKQV